MSDEAYEKALKKINDTAQKNLAHLDLGFYRLTHLPPEIGKLTNLTSVDLSNNQLTQLPAEIGKLTNIATFWLPNNKLTQLPSEVGKLTNLAHFILGGNQLTQLPVEINKLANLTELYLNNNQLTQWPIEINKLTNLTKLYLDNNQLTQLPAEIGNLTNLTKLRLSNNQLTQLPVEIGKLTNLTELRLKGNNFSLPDKVLKKDPQKIIKHILFANYREGKIVDNELLVSISTLRNIKEDELTKIAPWLNRYRIKAFFLVDKKRPDVWVLRKGETASRKIKQFLRNKLFIHYRKSQIIEGEFFVSIGTQRNLKKDELAKITEWLNTFRIKAFFAIDKKKPDIKLSRKPETAMYEIKQYLNKLFVDYKKGQIVDNELLVFVGTQRNLKEDEFVRITEWLNLFKIRAFFMLDKDKPDIQLSENSKTAIHGIKQYISNKYQNHISQVYDQKTQGEK